jgi:hypothetical protein
MAKGGRSIFMGLVLVFLISLFVIGGLRGIVNQIHPEGAEREGGFLNQFYQSFNHLSDPGTMAYDIESSAWLKFTAVLGGMIGIVILSALIAFITTALDQKIRELRKGHSKVIENGHTLILGWNERVVEILRELLMANESGDDECVVILSKLDKEKMDDNLNVHLPDRMNTRFVTRSGAESSLVNLDIVSVDTCKSVIVMAGCNVSATDAEKAVSDAIVTKSILAVIASRPPNKKLNIVAEVFHERNRQIVNDISPDEITTLDANEILAKILVQTSRSVGLSVVYSEILSFDGCEMYFDHYDWGEIKFRDIHYRFPDGVVMGLRHADGTLAVNPHPDTDVLPDDDILILAEDDSTIDYLDEPVVTPRDLPLPQRRLEPRIEHELLIGWTQKCETILREYSDYTLDGSTVDIMLRKPDDSVRDEIARIDAELSDLDVRLIDEDPLSTDGLSSIDPCQYDNIIILSQGGKDGIDDDEQTDSETIIILLLLRNIFETRADERCKTKLITEVLDSDNQPLVARTGVNDFIISNRFVSMLLAQISEDADIKRVYDDLFEEEGSEIYLKPTSLYFDEFPVKVTYADLIALAQKREEVCLGVKIKEFESDMDKNFGVKLIPEKDTEYTLTEEDTIVVLAEDDC